MERTFRLHTNINKDDEVSNIIITCFNNQECIVRSNSCLYHYWFDADSTTWIDNGIILDDTNLCGNPLLIHR
jgi:hypothetical protein